MTTYTENTDTQHTDTQHTDTQHTDTQHTDSYKSLQSDGRTGRVWLWWVLANVLGGAIIGLFSGQEDFLMHLVLRGFIVGAVQWMVLRRYLGHRIPHGALWWIPATGAGMALSQFLLLLPPLHTAFTGLYTLLYQQFGLWETFWINFLQEGVLWGLVGLFQWLVLRRLIGAGWWIGLGIAGGALLGMTAATTCYVACGAQIGPLAIGAIATDGAAWGAYGAVTGWGLWRILNGTE